MPPAGASPSGASARLDVGVGQNETRNWTPGVRPGFHLPPVGFLLCFPVTPPPINMETDETCL